MKTIYTIFAAMLLCVSAWAQAPLYSIQTVPLGTNAVAASSTLNLPITLSSVITTNPGTFGIFYTATNGSTNTVKFTLPVATNIIVTNLFIESNSIVGTNSIAWTVYEPILATNSTAYYVTNTGVTNSVQTNATAIHTNYQAFNLNTPVSFSAAGTNYSTFTNVTLGASALNVKNSATAALCVSFNLTGAGTSGVTFSYQQSTDGTTTNAAAQTFVLNGNGANTVATNINFNVGPFGFLNLVSIANANTAAVTNLVIKYAQKVNAP